MSGWSLPGYDMQALVGFGPSGEVWRARELATDDTVALKRLRGRGDPVEVEALRRAASLLRGLDTPYLVRLRSVVSSGADAVLVLDHAAGGSLASLLARRGPLEPGEVVTIGGPLARALAAAHGRGLVHGDIAPSSVLFTADGMPLLSDLGLARMAGVGGEPDAAADVWALAAVCHHMLAGASPHGRVDGAPLGRLAPSAPRSLVAAVEAGLTRDPAARPDAVAFAALLRGSHAPAPVRLTGRLPAADPLPEVSPAEGGRRILQGLLLGAGLAALLVVGGTVGWLSGRGAGASVTALPAIPVVSPPATSAAPAPTWTLVLDELDAARAQAFSVGVVAALSSVYAPGSPGLDSDTALLQSLVDQSRTAHGLRHAFRSAEVLASSGDEVRLRVVETLAAYEIRDVAGQVVGRTPARGERVLSVELTRTPDGWRLVAVRPET